MTHDHHDVVERSSGTGAVAVVAIVVLTVLAILAVMAFGGLDWLRGGDGDANPGVDNPPVDDGNPGGVPVEPPVEEPPAPAPGGFDQYSPGRA
jgi:hypothetical protein